MFDQSAILGKEAERAQSNSKTLQRIGGYFRPYWYIMLVVAILMFASTYMQVLIPDLTGQAVDCYLTPFLATESMNSELGQMMEKFAPQAEKAGEANCWYTSADLSGNKNETLRQFGILIGYIIALYLLSAVFTGLLFYLMSWTGNKVLRDLNNNVFSHIHELSLSYFNTHKVGDLMSRLTNDVDTLQQMIGFGLVQVLQSILLIVWTVWVMLSKNWVFALISLVTLPFMFYATKWFSDQARKAFRRARQEIGSVNADLQESIAAVREVQAFSREDENIEQFRSQNAANRDANVRAQAFTSALAPTLEAFGYVSLAVVAVVGGILLLREGDLFGTTLSVGLIITFINYTQQFNRPVQQISVLWTNLQSAIAGAERIFNLLDANPEIKDKPNAIVLKTTQGHVLLEDVWAEYKAGEPVLRGVTIEAKPGETVAIVGPTGAGKTTIINLMPRFWDVTKGRVLIDGVNVKDVTQHSLREQMGIVLQDTFLFSDTVLNNIRYGRPNATEAEVIGAAKLAKAHDFIMGLSDGYQTVLGERGRGLSQGQRQLLSIARIALTDPRILILDEATSSVDTRTELQIQAALDQLLAGRTSFVIAHRLSTIRNADKVIVLRAGEIAEQGTHDTLLAQKGVYYDLYMSQFRHVDA